MIPPMKVVKSCAEDCAEADKLSPAEQRAYLARASGGNEAVGSHRDVGRAPLVALNPRLFTLKTQP